MKLNNMTLAGQGIAQPESSQNDISSIIHFSKGVIGGREMPTVNARNLHNFLENGELFATWIKKRVEQYGFVKGTDYETFLEGAKKGRPREEYRISSDMAKELSMVERNEKGKQARQYFIDCEERLRQVAPEEHQSALNTWRQNRVAACEDHKSMTDAMKGYIERTGDNQKGYAYSNECTFLNRLVLGMHPPVWARQKGIPAKKVRDHMNTGQLALVAYLESRDCALLDLDTGTDERKAKLTELAQRWLARRVGGAV